MQDLSAVPWPVRTERLSIRPATVADLEPTWEFRRRPEVSAWLTSLPSDLEGYRDRFDRPLRLSRTLVIELGEPGGPIVGDLMLWLKDAWAQSEVEEQGRRKQVELGWVVHPDHAGRGIATEAVAALLRVCFEDLGVHRVEALCFADNEASWRLMERVGMRREAHYVAESLHRSGRWLDSYAYAVLADEWRDRS
ncbi:RimJ/RimL family protein N-acetyltransferase [Nocardioides ginsengisegetis]|uniref:RimJ/RimL family protein N-acetyltransferase n=1 Tax=Nocardioides ginsengisegetis TaxID=661491 RepID=A0A7W3J3L5_9ACTN|nr:RimJ/RimL family protein N-acetyltransferase [Nocardioides ginsengisegetis]